MGHSVPANQLKYLMQSMAGPSKALTVSFPEFSGITVNSANLTKITETRIRIELKILSVTFDLVVE